MKAHDPKSNRVPHPIKKSRASHEEWMARKAQDRRKQVWVEGKGWFRI